MDKSSDTLYETSLQGHKESQDVVHLTHPTTLQSIYHPRLGFASYASRPYDSQLYLWLMWPLTWTSMLLTWAFGSTFDCREKQHQRPWQRAIINRFIEKAILDADKGGVKVIRLGLLNQGEELYRNGDLYLQKYPNLNVKIVDGTSLAVAVVLHSIPLGTRQVLFRGNLTKTGYVVAQVLCQQNIQVWLAGDGITHEEQRKAPKGTCFVPFSQLPPKKVRKDCNYYSTLAMAIPKALEDMHAFENWLPRRMMSAWRISGIVHALEGWNSHECGDTVLDVDEVWLAALHRRFMSLSRA